MSTLILKSITGPLPMSEYELFDGDTSIGIIQIRHKPSHSSEVPPDFASNIFYEIKPEFRHKGYGEEILRLGILEARELGLKQIIVTCLQENTASRKIIEKNGGVFGSVTETTDGKKLLKYTIAP